MLKIKNLNINKNKIIIILLFICLINFYTINSTSTNENNYENKFQSNNTFFNIDILDVSGGIGLDIIIKNNGENNLENIILKVEIDDNSIIIQKKYVVSALLAGDTTSKHVTIFGFNIGLIREHSKISIIISHEQSSILESQITAIIIGPYVSVISKNFDNENDEGYILYCPMWSTTTYLITNEGNVVHTWENSIYQDSQSTYLLDNGNLVRTSLVAKSSFTAGGYQGRVEIFDWNDTQVWNFEYSKNEYCSHHDIQPLPNGNILLIAWEKIPKNEVINAGRNPNNLGEYLWSDYIIEVKTTGPTSGDIVWEWHVWDHLIQDYDPAKENYGVVSDHPELIDINSGGRRTDWLHTNSIDYNSELDQILLSVHNFNEIWIIDHSTTSEEATGHTGGNSGKGGDLLYRWGNPAAYQLGTINDQKYFGQHGATWVKTGYPGEGNILVFNNGVGGLEGYSTVDEIIPPLNEYGLYDYVENESYLPEEQTWRFSTENPQDMYSRITSNVLRLPNGNTLICDSNQGHILEVTNDKNVIWDYLNPYPTGFFNKNVARVQWYGPKYPGLRFLK